MTSTVVKPASNNNPQTQQTKTVLPAPQQTDSSLSPLERQRKAIAAALGEKDIALAQPRWLELMREGVIVGLHIKRWRASVKLAYSDLGLPDADADAPLSDLIELGEKRLLPRRIMDALNSVESNARKCLDRFAYKTFWGYFLPASAYAEWKAQNEAYRQKYIAIRDEIVASYDQILAELTTEYTKAAKAAYHNLKLLDPAAAKGHAEQDEQGFVSAFVARITALIPTAEAISQSFDYSVILSYVPLPSLLAADTAERERITTHRRAESEREARMRELEREVSREAEAQKKELVGGFLKDLVGQLRALAYEATTDVLTAMEKNEKLVGKSAAQLRNLVAQVESLNFFGDVEMDAAIKRVQAVLDTKPKERDMSELRRELQAIGTLTRATLLDFGASPRSARSLGVADIPSADMVRTARRTLGIEGVAETLPIQRGSAPSNP